MTPSSFQLDTVGYVILFVKDMKASVAFYRDTLSVPVRSESPEWTELETKGTTVALHRADKVPPPQEALPNVVFSVDDVRAAHATLRGRNVKVDDLKAVWESPEIVGVAGNLRDPDGNQLSIYGTMPAAQWNR